MCGRALREWKEGEVGMGGSWRWRIWSGWDRSCCLIFKLGEGGDEGQRRSERETRGKGCMIFVI